MLIVGVGLAVGLGGTYAAARVLSSLWVGVSPRDPLIYGLVTALLLVIAGLANFIPAYRAARLHPMRALRGE